MKVVRFVVMLLMVIGSLNWGLVGFFQYDLVADIFGGMSTGAARFIYGLVGIAGLIGLARLCKCCCCKSCCKTCSGGSCGSGNCNCGNPNCGCNKNKREL